MTQQEVYEGSPPVGSLIATDICVHPAATVRTVVEQFFGSAHMEALAVVEGREAIGLVTRQKLLFTVFRRYGFELYGRKPVIMIADTEPLSICERERLDVAINKALARPSQDVYDEIIITDEAGHYKGLLPVRQMIIQQSNVLANSIVQREIAHERAKELEKINHVKSQFIANVTHELRSPVNAIIGGGTVTVCAVCKKIQGRRGIWRERGDFRTLPPEGRYSRGLCPECLQEHYVDLFQEKR